jgi:hypothetical protein
VHDRSSGRNRDEVWAFYEGTWLAATAFMRCRRDLLKNRDPAQEGALLARTLLAIDDLERRLLEDDAIREFRLRVHCEQDNDESVASVRAAAVRLQRSAAAERELVRAWAEGPAPEEPPQTLAG